MGLFVKDAETPAPGPLPPKPAPTQVEIVCPSVGVRYFQTRPIGHGTVSRNNNF